MATVTIHTDLTDFCPVYNRMEVEVKLDSTTLALTDVQYIFDVYIEGVSGFKRFQVPPDPTTEYAAVDISRYCESYCYPTLAQYNSSVPFSIGANANGTQSILKVNIKYGYSYSNSGVYTVVADVLTGGNKYAFQGALTERALMGWNDGGFNDYICNITNGANGQFITDMKTNDVSLNNLGWHHILTDTPTDIDKLVIETYDSSGNLIALNIKAITVAQNLTASRMYKVATAPESLNNMTGGWISGGPQPIITSSVSYYLIYLVDTPGNIASETLRFNLVEPCRYRQCRIFFENRFGSFDSYNFNLRSQIDEEVKRSSYKYNKFPITSSGLDRQYQDQSQVVNYIEVQEYLTVRSNYLTTEQNSWLKQLVQSGNIYLQIEDHDGAQNYLAYEMVTQTNWVEKETSIDKLFILELKLKLSQTNTRQRR